MWVALNQIKVGDACTGIPGTAQRRETVVRKESGGDSGEEVKAMWGSRRQPFVVCNSQSRWLEM